MVASRIRTFPFKWPLSFRKYIQFLIQECHVLQRCPRQAVHRVQPLFQILLPEFQFIHLLSEDPWIHHHIIEK